MSETVLTGPDMNKVIFKMLRVLVLYVAVLCSLVRGQSVSCKDDAQCRDGFYCEMDALICRKCLSCQDLKREPPKTINTCIKSVAECGACINELVVDQRGDLNAECVPSSTSPPGTMPSYVWVLIGIGVLLFLALVVGIIAYLLRYPEIFKNVGSNQSSTVTARITATAPEAPPPYNLPSQFPYQSPPYTDVELTPINEEELFIKRPLPQPQDAREAADNQTANRYNKPFYEREPGVEFPVAEKPEPPIQDEDTMPSAWTPEGTTSNRDVNAKSVDNDDSAAQSAQSAHTAQSAQTAQSATSLPALLSAARDTTLVEHSAAKKRCVRQESRESNCGDNCGDNYGDNYGDSYGDSSNSPPGPHGPPGPTGPLYSFVTQITNVVHIDTNKRRHPASTNTRLP